LEIKHSKDYSNFSKITDDLKVSPEAKINLGIVNSNLANKDERPISNTINNDEDFLKNMDEDVLKSLQTDIISEMKSENNKGGLIDKTKGSSYVGSKDSNLKLDEEDLDNDF
jgi:hypothetical protein